MGAGLAVRIACTVGVLLAVVASPARAAGPAINGGGSSFAELELDQWRRDVAVQGVSVNYSSSSSGLGRTQFAQGLVDFAGTDIPYQPEDPVKATRPFLYVNVSAGGLGFMFHLTDTQGNRVNQLDLTPEQVCRFFTYSGTDNYWDAPDIQAVNPDVSLPHELVHPVARNDPAGTSYVFMQFCIADAPDVWKAAINWCIQWCATKTAEVHPVFLDGQPHSIWPQPCNCLIGDADTNANTVASPLIGDGDITYVETGFAKVRGFPVASIRNSSGAYTQPTAANVNEALAFATTAGDGTLRLAFDAPRPDVYFPSTYSYILVPTTSFDPAKGSVLARFLDHAVTDGQAQAELLGYAPLACGIVSSALDDIARIPGAPARPAYPCKVPDPGTGPVAGPAADPLAGSSSAATSGGGGAPRGSPGAATSRSALAPASSKTSLAPAVGGPRGTAGPASGVAAAEGGAAATTGTEVAPAGSAATPAALGPPLSVGAPIPPSAGDVLGTVAAGAALSALGLGLSGTVRRRRARR
ncbi:MAG TPA: substrate-binding domain-containing protein [Actinomycetota bacterium]